MNIKLHQALFGYEGGHQLLASSVRLPNQARHALAVATDISGSAPESGFEKAFTGFQLPETEYFSLFCTWLAPEMRRPGCVWSHVLLIELPDIAEIRDLGTLRTFFTRPTTPLVTENYARPLEYRHSIHDTPLSAIKDDSVALPLINALYGDSIRPVILPAIKSSDYEALIFSIWSQQWPKLRRNFCFSTGSFADRATSGSIFDLQVTPIGNLHAWPRNGKHLIIEPEFSKKLLEAWVEEALYDLHEPNIHGLRAFMSQYGADLLYPRASFASLTKAFHGTRYNKAGNWKETLRNVAQDFPQPSDALRLKEGLISFQENTRIENLETIWETLLFLLNDPYAAAYSEISNPKSLVMRLWVDNRPRLLDKFSQLIQLDATPITTSFATALTDVLHPDDLRYVWEIHPELLSTIVRNRPDLSFDDDVWQLPISAQRRVLDALFQSDLKKKDWTEVIVAMLSANSDLAGKEAVVRAGHLAIEAIYRWVEGGGLQNHLPSNIWREAFEVLAVDQLNSMSLSPLRLALCAWLAPINEARRISGSRSDIQALVREPFDELPKPLHLPTAFFITTVGLLSDGHSGLPLLARGFMKVHNALATDDYPWESWQLLSPLLPSLGWFRDWDRCEKLRRALRDWLLEHHISMDSFDRTTDTLTRQYAPENMR